MSKLVDGTCRAANNADAKGQGIECLLRIAEGDAQLWSQQAARGAIAELGNLKCHAAYSTLAQPDSAIMKPPTEEHLLQFWQGAKRKQQHAAFITAALPYLRKQIMGTQFASW